MLFRNSYWLEATCNLANVEYRSTHSFRLNGFFLLVKIIFESIGNILGSWKCLQNNVLHCWYYILAIWIYEYKDIIRYMHLSKIFFSRERNNNIFFIALSSVQILRKKYMNNNISSKCQTENNWWII